MKNYYGNQSNHCSVIGRQRPNMFGAKYNQLTNKSLSSSSIVMESKADKILVQQAQFRNGATRSPQPSPSGVTTILFMIIMLAYIWCSSCYATSSSSPNLFASSSISSAKQQTEPVSPLMTTLPSPVKSISRISKGDEERSLYEDQQRRIGANYPEQGQGHERKTSSVLQKRLFPSEDITSEDQSLDIYSNINRDLSLITENSDGVYHDDYGQQIPEMNSNSGLLVQSKLADLKKWPPIPSEERLLLSKIIQNSGNHSSLLSPGWYGNFNQDKDANVDDGDRFGGHPDLMINKDKRFPAIISGSTESMLQPDGFETINHLNKLLLSPPEASSATIAEVANQPSNSLGPSSPVSFEKLAKTKAKQEELLMKMRMMALEAAKNRKYVQESPDRYGKYDKNMAKQYLMQLFYKNHLNWNPFWLWVIQQQQQPGRRIFDYYHQQNYQNERKYPDLFDPNEINGRHYQENHNQPEQQLQEQPSASSEMMMMMMKRFRTEKARSNDRNDVMNEVGHGTTTKMLQKNRANKNKSYHPNGNITIANNNEINQNFPQRQQQQQRPQSKSRNRYYRQRVNQSNVVNNDNYKDNNNKNLARDHYYENGKNSKEFRRHPYYHQNQNNRKQKPGKQIKPKPMVNLNNNNNNKDYHYRPVDEVYAEEMAIISAANDFAKQRNRTEINSLNDEPNQGFKASNKISNNDANYSGKNPSYRNYPPKVEWNKNGQNSMNRNRYRPPKPTKSPVIITTTTSTRMESSILHKSTEQKHDYNNVQPKQQLFQQSAKPNAFSPRNPSDFGHRSPPVYGVAKSRSQRHLGEYDQSPQSQSSSSVVSSKLYDVPQIECPSSENGMDRFACPTRDDYGRYLCIDDQHICDGYYDCPRGEDEDRRNCMFYKSTKAHLDLLADYLLQWARGQQNM